MDFFAARSVFSVRPRMAILAAPALAKARAIAKPIPVPAIVMAIVFPFADRAGRYGSIAS